MNAKKLAELAESLFKKKAPLDSLNQEIAENFFPQRADFTYSRSLGTELAANLSTSYPILARRELSNQFTTMLRPTAKPWFHPARKYSDKKEERDNDVRKHLEWFEEVMRRAMYDPPSLFTRAMKLHDEDISAFGQAAVSVEMNKNADGLLYRCWHLRDMAWQENEEGQIGFVCRKWKPTLQVASRTFPGRLHENLEKRLSKEPFSEVEFVHIVCDAEMYEDNSMGRPRWSIWWDKENSAVIEASPIWGKHYVIPRWQLVSSQYAYSPAVVAALPDARLIQAMTYTLLEVGEKASNPPLIGTKDAVRSDVAVYAGGITWVDAEYDERLGDALRPLNQDFRGLNFGLDLTQDTRSMIHKAFYLDTLTLPVSAPEMTAYEVGQRVQEYIRNAMPLFEPMENESNAGICEETFELLLRNGAFGSPNDWPSQMRGMDIDFRFESPLHDVVEQQKGQKWMEGKALLADAVSLDPSSRHIWDATTALRDALASVGVPAKWLRNEDDMSAMIRQEQGQIESQQALSAMEQGSNVAVNLAKAENEVA